VVTVKLLTAPLVDCERLRDADARLGGLPVRGRLVGNGPGVLGDGVTTWFGYTRWRYPVDPVGPQHTYVVDEPCETALAHPSAIVRLGAAECAAVRLIVARAVAIDLPPVEPARPIPPKERP